jgi:hypothetical protein
MGSPGKHVGETLDGDTLRPSRRSLYAEKYAEKYAGKYRQRYPQ